MKYSLQLKFVPWLVAAAAGVTVLVTTSRAFDWPATGTKGVKTSLPVVVNDAPLSRETKLTSSFSPIVKKVGPSVVNVFSTKRVKSPYGPGMSPFFDEPFFRRFFGDQPDSREARPRPRVHKEQSLGSGVIVTKDGYILTNNHVVDGADEVKVARDKDKTEYTAKVVGRDSKTDLALLKIDAKDLPFATLGDSDKIEVGDVVLAIGNPFGIGQTVTMGIISATKRGNIGIEDYEDFLQTDASINPGNSGGALIDAEGRVIGINTAILSRTGGNQGVGFAVPINLARSVMEHLTQDGKVVRGYLGVSIQELTPELARQFHVADAVGALVGGVTEKSAAAEAGLKSGDVIIEFGGQPVPDSRNLKLMAGRTSPGAKVTVKALRDGKEKTFQVTLKEMPDRGPGVAREESEGNSSDALDGVEVGNLTPALRNQYQLPDDLKGAIITNLDPNSASYEASLRVGDVIVELNRKPVANADEAVELSKHFNSKRVLVRVWSQGGSRYLIVDETKEK